MLPFGGRARDAAGTFGPTPGVPGARRRAHDEARRDPGGGTGGTLTANRLGRLFGTDEMAITVVDQDDRHVYQPGLLFVPFGLAHVEDIVRPRARQPHRVIDFVQARVDRVDIASRRVLLGNGAALDYDVLVVASGGAGHLRRRPPRRRRGRHADQVPVAPLEFCFVADHYFHERGTPTRCSSPT